MPVTPSVPVAQPRAAPGATSTPLPSPGFSRLTVRFTQAEARLLEKVRGIARSLGYKISDTAAFRLALNSFDADHMTAGQIESVLKADTRRK